MEHKDFNEPEPKMRHDKRGKYRIVNSGILTTMGSWDTYEEADAWATWNNFGEKPHGFGIIENPEL